MLTYDNLFSKIFNIKKKFNIEINKENISISFCRFELIILSNELVGIKPPAETRLILRFNELNILTSEMFNSKKIIKLNAE